VSFSREKGGSVNAHVGEDIPCKVLLLFLSSLKKEENMFEGAQLLKAA